MNGVVRYVVDGVVDGMVDDVVVSYLPAPNVDGVVDGVVGGKVRHVDDGVVDGIVDGVVDDVVRYVVDGVVCHVVDGVIYDVVDDAVCVRYVVDGVVCCVFGDDDLENDLHIRFRIRLQCWRDVKPIMLNAISGERAKGKGSRNRKFFVTALRCLLRVFTTKQEEYHYINKFGRGIWTKKYIQCFNAEVQDLINRVIAREMGAFDY